MELNRIVYGYVDEMFQKFKDKDEVDFDLGDFRIDLKLNIDPNFNFLWLANYRNEIRDMWDLGYGSMDYKGWCQLAFENPTKAREDILMRLSIGCFREVLISLECEDGIFTDSFVIKGKQEKIQKYIDKLIKF